MVAPAREVNLGCTAEIADHDHERIGEQATLLQILQQRRKRLIELRHQRLRALLVLRVGVVTAVEDGG